MGGRVYQQAGRKQNLRVGDRGQAGISQEAREEGWSGTGWVRGRKCRRVVRTTEDSVATGGCGARVQIEEVISWMENRCERLGRRGEGEEARPGKQL